MHKIGAGARKPTFDLLEDRSLLSGYHSMPAGLAFDFAPHNASSFHGFSPPYASPMGNGTDPPHGSWDAPGGGFSPNQNTWPAPTSPSTGAQSWQPGNDLSTPAEGASSGSSGGAGISPQPSGQSSIGPSPQASPTVGPASAPSTPAAPGPNGPSANDSPTGGQVPQRISVPSTVGTAANAPEAASEVAAVTGLAQLGLAPLPQQTSLPLASIGGSNARPAMQANIADSSMGPLLPDASVTVPALARSKRVRGTGTSAPQQIKPIVGDDAGLSLLPISADVIARIIPFDRAALERAIDRLIDQLDGGGARELLKRGPARIILFSMALAGSALALEVLRRRWSAAGELRAHCRSAREDLIGFPELPGSWWSRIP